MEINKKNIAVIESSAKLNKKLKEFCMHKDDDTEPMGMIKIPQEKTLKESSAMEEEIYDPIPHTNDMDIPAETILDKWAKDNIKSLSYIELRDFLARLRKEHETTKALSHVMTCVNTMSGMYGDTLNTININSKLDSLKTEGTNLRNSMSEYTEQFKRLENICISELEKYKDTKLTTSFLSNEYIKSIEHNIEHQKHLCNSSDNEDYISNCKIEKYQKQIELYKNRQNIIEYFLNETYAKNKKYIRKVNQYLGGMPEKTFNTTKKNLCKFISEEMLSVFEHEMRKFYKMDDTRKPVDDKIVRLFVFFYMILDKYSHTQGIHSTIISIIVLNVNDIAAGLFDIENPDEHMKKIVKLLEIV